MSRTNILSPSTLFRDLTAGMVVFLVALPLCLGVALASEAPLFSGLIAGIVGGILVGILSGSHSSVSGPAAGLTAIVAMQITKLGSFDTFLLAVVVAGIIQVGLGLAKAGFIGSMFPSSVIQGLLAAIGTILILKQIPHLLGHDSDPEGEMTFVQPDHENTFTELFRVFQELLRGEFQTGAIAIGLVSLVFLILWDQIKPLKKSLVPAPLIVVLLGVALSELFSRLGGAWAIEATHLVQVPVANSLSEFTGFLTLPDFSQLANPAVYLAGITVAIVASLESLLNLDAVDKLDRKQRLSPPSRELLAQGIGNITAGMIGGLPVTCVVIRGSVNINSGSQTKLSTIVHGFLLLFCVMLIPTLLNKIPLSCLAAILLMTGFKLASPKVFQRMMSEGRYQFLPFVITLVAIVATDLLIGILIGLSVSLLFILKSNLTRPIRRIVEKHVGGEVLHIELANQVSFLNRAALENALRGAPRGTHILLDARRTDYIDPDILSLIREFKDITAPVYDVQVSLRGFRNKYHLADDIQFVDYATRELHAQLTPMGVLQILKDGNQRFRTGHRLDRDLTRTLTVEAIDEHPMVVIFSGIDPRTPAEMIFDLGPGDAFSIRIAGNVAGPRVLGSMEYGCVIGGAKLILIMGHTGSKMIKHSIEHACLPKEVDQPNICPNLESILLEIQQSIELSKCQSMQNASEAERSAFVDSTTRHNVIRSVQQVVLQSPPIRRLVEEKRVAVVGALYDIASGKVEFLIDESVGLSVEVSQS